MDFIIDYKYKLLYNQYMTKKRSRIRFLLHSKTLLKTIVNHFRKTALNLDTEKDINVIANRVMNYNFDCRTPRTFNEFLSWIKCNYRNDLWKKCADKLELKQFLKQHGFGDYVVKTYKTYKSSSEIKLSELPDKFVLKTNHDCGSVFICDKHTTDFDAVFKKLDNSLKNNYSILNGEWVYKDIKPLIFAEELLIPAIGTKIIDYKFFCFNGKFGWGFTGQDRENDTRFCVFESNFLIQDVEYIYIKPPKNKLPPKPSKYDEMVKVSEKLSMLLDFVRVDFYDTTKGPKIGELTFFSQSGLGVFSKKQYDFKYGSFFKTTKLYLASTQRKTVL